MPGWLTTPAKGLMISSLIR